MATQTVPRRSVRFCSVGLRPPRGESPAQWSWRTGSTRPGFLLPWSHCAAAEVSGATRRRIRTRRSPRDAKGELDVRMEPGRAYHPTVDQPALTALFDMAQAYSRSRSFRRIVRAVGSLVAASGIPPVRWPPAGWVRPEERS